MRLDRQQLKKLIVEVARDTFGRDEFPRRQLMLRVEERLRATGDWESGDNAESGSKGKKSKGLAEIDYAISELAAERELDHLSRNKWRLHAQTASQRTNGNAVNGTNHTDPMIAERLRRLSAVTARYGGPAVKTASVQRSDLYGDER